MVDAVPQYLDPVLGATPPRPAGLGVGDYPQQANAALLAWWTLGVSTRAIRQPFGDAVGSPLHYEYDTCNYNLLAIDCRGDPDHPDDRSVVQIAQDNPPQAGRVFTTWFGFDWRHSTLSPSASFNRGLVLKTANAFLGTQDRGGLDRPCLAVNSIAPNGGTAVTGLAAITIVEPGSATVAGRDCPLISEDGSAPAPQPLRVPCWVGRWGHRGAVGQVLAGGSTTQNLGFVLKVKPVTGSFTEDAANLRIVFATATAEYGCEVYGACTYAMAYLEPLATYQDPDYTQPSPYPCKIYGDRCWKSREQTATIQIYLTPLGDSWQAIVAIHQVGMMRSAAGGRYVLYSNFSPGFYTGKGSLSLAAGPSAVSATVVGCGTTTTITRSLFGGDATLTVTIVVSVAGLVTTCEARITRSATVTNLGPGWHDKFLKV